MGDIGAFLPVGGAGTRVRQFTKGRHKALIEVDGTPILGRLVNWLGDAGVNRVVLGAFHQAEQICGWARQWSSTQRTPVVEVVVEPRASGTVGGLALVDSVPDTVVVANGDIVCTEPLEPHLADHIRQGRMATIFTHPYRWHCPYGVIQTNHDQCAVGIIEKPTFEEQIAIGVYILDGNAVNYIERDVPQDMPTLLERLISARHLVKAVPISGSCVDFGSPATWGKIVKKMEPGPGLGVVQVG